MANYDFESKDFALSPQGIHLLRHRFNYKTINFNDVFQATFTRGVQTKNQVLTFIVGVLLIAFAVYQSIAVYADFHDPNVSQIYIESIAATVLPTLVGFYCIYIAVKKVPLLIIEPNGEKHKLSLQEIINSGRLHALETYLKEKLREKFDVGPSL